MRRPAINFFTNIDLNDIGLSAYRSIYIGLNIVYGYEECAGITDDRVTSCIHL